MKNGTGLLAHVPFCQVRCNSIKLLRQACTLLLEQHIGQRLTALR
jgi:hypothetical protein